MMDELRKLRELTETLTGNGYLRDQAEEWEYTLNAITDPIYIINHKSQIKFVNNALADCLGVSKEDCMDKICYEFMMELSSDSIPDDWCGKTNIEETTTLVEQRLTKLNGWFNINRSPIYTDTKKFLGFICTLIDVTAEKKSRDVLAEKGDMLETIFNEVPIGIGLLDLTTKTVKSVNQVIVDITGYSAEELIGKSAMMLYPSQEEFDRVCSMECGCIGTKVFMDVETFWLTKEGTVKNIYLKVSKIDISNDVVFTAADITDIRQVEQRMHLFVGETRQPVNQHHINETLVV